MKKEYDPQIVGTTDVLGGAIMMMAGFCFLCALSISSPGIFSLQIFFLTESLHSAAESRAVIILGEIMLLRAAYVVFLTYGIFVMVRAACQIYAGFKRIFANNIPKTNTILPN